MYDADNIDVKLKQGFQSLFPEYATLLNQATSQEQIISLHNSFIEERKKALATAIKATNISDSRNPKSPIALTQEEYENLINATGDDIKYRIQALLDGLQRLKGMENDQIEHVAAQMIVTGILGIGVESTTAALAIAGGGEIIEAYIALAALTSTTVAVVIAVVCLVIIAIIIPLIYFMEKPANALILLINELDKPLVFANDFNVHGKPTYFTETINNAVIFPDRKFVTAGFIGSQKLDSALYGTQYGFTMKYGHTDTQFTFGVECPLSSLYTDNNCFCAFDKNAQEAAELTAQNNKQFWETEKDGIKLSIRCNSKSGSLAYYVARAYHV